MATSYNGFGVYVSLTNDYDMVLTKINADRLPYTDKRYFQAYGAALIATCVGLCFKTGLFDLFMYHLKGFFSFTLPIYFFVSFCSYLVLLQTSRGFYFCSMAIFLVGLQVIYIWQQGIPALLFLLLGAVQLIYMLDLYYRTHKPAHLELLQITNEVLCKAIPRTSTLCIVASLLLFTVILYAFALAWFVSISKASMYFDGVGMIMLWLTIRLCTQMQLRFITLCIQDWFFRGQHANMTETSTSFTLLEWTSPKKTTDYIKQAMWLPLGTLVKSLWVWRLFHRGYDIPFVKVTNIYASIAHCPFSKGIDYLKRDFAYPYLPGQANVHNLTSIFYNLHYLLFCHCILLALLTKAYYLLTLLPLAFILTLQILNIWTQTLYSSYICVVLANKLGQQHRATIQNALCFNR